MSVGDNILKLRKRLGLSQGGFAEKLFLSRQTVSQWETDQTMPTLDNLKIICDVFGVSTDEILGVNVSPEAVRNTESLDSICAALAYSMGIEPPEYAAPKNCELSKYIDRVFDGEKADRIIMYNPDAIAQWIYEKYIHLFNDVLANVDVKVPLASVMPSVTPVCFGTMYTGAQPEIHGIQKYEKPVIKIDTIFDALIRAGKKIALITYGKVSLSRIFLERNIDYFHFEEGNIVNVNAKAVEVILRDEHDFVVIYNGNYDAIMHKYGPESAEALGELRTNCHIFSCITELVKNNWKHHNTLLGFAMDHGCHEIDGNSGSHGLDMLEDINIVHLYKGFGKEK
ncbi:MAG: helix-turn-helix domain-containing protein [Clostridia bacterium]|nr:helix-turn-helix domain-containing protein [Oscillospiraceae bacterium]MBQ7033684.1 helix-turn-helix domain-containing protein [Clostridia bacterium]